MLWHQFSLHSCTCVARIGNMSFSGRVTGSSHEGGLIVSFEGRAPKLGANIRVSGGRILGKVDTVLGPVDAPLIHVHPLVGGVNSSAAIGSPVEIAPRIRAGRGRSRGGSRGNHPPKHQSRRGGRGGGKATKGRFERGGTKRGAVKRGSRFKSRSSNRGPTRRSSGKRRR